MKTWLVTSWPLSIVSWSLTWRSGTTPYKAPQQTAWLLHLKTKDKYDRMGDWWKRNDGMKWTAPGSYCGLILCPSGICSHELKPPQLWKLHDSEVKITGECSFCFMLCWCNLMPHSLCHCGIIIRMEQSHWKVRCLLSLMRILYVSVLLNGCDTWDMKCRYSHLSLCNKGASTDLFCRLYKGIGFCMHQHDPHTRWR